MLKICPESELWRFGICGWQEGMVVIDMMGKYMKYKLWGFIKLLRYFINYLSLFLKTTEPC